MFHTDLLKMIIKMNGISDISIRFDIDKRLVVAGYKKHGKLEKYEIRFSDIEAIFTPEDSIGHPESTGIDNIHRQGE